MKYFICETCGEKVEVADRLPKIKLCLVCKSKRSFKKKCRDCESILELPIGSKVILCEKCLKISFANHQKSKEIQINCRRCGKRLGSKIKKSSKGKDEARLCDDCRYKHDKFIRYKICRCCLKILSYDNIDICHQTNIKHHYTTCCDCKHTIKINRIVNKKIPTIKSYKICKYCLKVHSYKMVVSSNKHWYYTCDDCKISIVNHNTSIRLKSHNPMFRDEVKQKTANTIKSKIKSGEYVVLRGKQRYNYKGNRSIYSSCRLAIGEWIKTILSIDNFTCRRCGKYGGILHVHHLQSFKLMVDNILNKFNCSEKIKPSEFLYDVIVEEVVNLHNTDIGVTVCPLCHESIDFHYRSTKNASKDRKKCEQEELSIQFSLRTGRELFR